MSIQAYDMKQTVIIVNFQFKFSIIKFIMGRGDVIGWLHAQFFFSRYGIHFEIMTFELKIFVLAYGMNQSKYYNYTKTHYLS